MSTTTEPEAVSAELVRAPSAEPEQADQQGTASAIERAAQAALDMPGIPGRDEFLSLAAQARLLCLSGAAPEAVRNNPHIAFHVAMVGRDLGISPSAALQLIDVIKTRSGYQLSLSPQLLNGQIRRLKLGAIRPLVQERDRCVAQAVGPDGTVLGETEFTWEDARDAELVGPRCMPGEHVKDQQRSKDGRSWKVCGCNQGYLTYPRRMMWWRASGFCAADYFPEAGLGLYSPEELGAVVDDDGRPLDPATVALPPGYDDPGEQRRTQQAERQAQREAPASPDELWQLQERIAALPEGIKTGLAKAWTGPQSRVRGVPARAVPRRLLTTAKALVNAHWAQANATGADMEARVDDVRREAAERVLSVLAAPRGTPPDPEQPLSGPVAASEPSPAPNHPGGDQGEREAQQGPDGEQPEPDAPPEVDWRPALRAVADNLRALAQGVPDAVFRRIADDVKALHHTAVNKELDEAELSGTYPPNCPIDLRRMAVSALRLEAFRQAGVLPGNES